MSANLWKAENVIPAEALEDGIYACSGTRGVRTNVALDRLATNQTFHCGFSVNPGANDKFSMALWYRDAAGYANYAFSTDTSAPAGKWTRVSGSVVVPSGMTVYQMVICNNNNASGSSGWKVMNPTLSLGSPVTLASSAHTPYATQDHISATYATKASLKVTDDSIKAEVSDALTTAKSYTDGSVQREAIARDAAIKAQADSISLSVSKTYTKSETFSAYQTDADGRIATANANASTAVSTAKTAASDAATAKTNAAEAKAETKDLVMLRIDSSRGTVFKNSEVSTALTVRCYKRGEEITTLTALRDAMGDQTARIRWYVLRDGDTEWVSLADSDEKLSEDGFVLTLKPSDIDIKCTFKAEVVTD